MRSAKKLVLEIEDLNETPVLEENSEGRHYRSFPINGESPVIIIGRSNYFKIYSDYFGQLPENVHLIGIGVNEPNNALISSYKKKPGWLTRLFKKTLPLPTVKIFALGGKRTYLNDEKVGPIPMDIGNDSELRVGGNRFRVNTYVQEEPHPCYIKDLIESNTRLYSFLEKLEKYIPPLSRRKPSLQN